MTTPMIELPEIILASGSPRRSELLNSVGWKFTKVVADVNEDTIDGESAKDYVRRLAVTKASKVAAANGGRIVLGADTTVVLDGDIIGKPLDLDDARSMIRRLSGKWHKVLTGAALVRDHEVVADVESTRVKFAKMTDLEIDFLSRTGDPLDKAGAYAVQAQAALFIERIEGDYWNVVGLPVRLVYKLFDRLGMIET